MFYQNFVYLCERDGLAKSNVCKKLGLSENAWKRWENNSTPRRQTVVAVSKFFGVDYENMLHKDISTIDAEETDSIKARQELFENTEMRVLFDAAKDVAAYKDLSPSGKKAFWSRVLTKIVPIPETGEFLLLYTNGNITDDILSYVHKRLI